jgi:hypothetical protein
MVYLCGMLYDTVVRQECDIEIHFVGTQTQAALRETVDNTIIRKYGLYSSTVLRIFKR